MFGRMEEPWEAEERHQIELERNWKAYLRGNPECMICGAIIEEDRCYVLDHDAPMETSVHKDCISAQIKKMKTAKVDTSFIDWLQEELDYVREERTPHRG